MAQYDGTKWGKPLKVHLNCTVVSVGSGSYPRYIDVRLPGTDGPLMTAVWNGPGNIPLSVNDKVKCNEYADLPFLEIAGANPGRDQSAGLTRVSKVYDSTLTSEVISADASSVVTFGSGASATEARAGVAEIATQTETDTETDDARIVTPLKLATRLAAAFAMLDLIKVSKIWESDGGGVALASDADGNMTAAADLTVTSTAYVDQRVESPLYEFPLILTGGEGSHFLDNDSSYPAGWTEADAASATDTETLYSHWYLVGTSSETSWKYRIQTSTDLENDVAASAQCRFMFGPVIFKNAAYTADVDYYFGMYRNNAGAIDENTFCRVHLQWSSSGSVWRIRGETKDSSSSTQHDGAWTNFSLPVNSRFWLVLGVTNAAAKTCLSYAGANYTPAGAGSLAAEFMNNLQVQNPTTALTWGTVWLQVHQTRGAGATDRLLIGAYDRLS